MRHASPALENTNNCCQRLLQSAPRFGGDISRMIVYTHNQSKVVARQRPILTQFQSIKRPRLHRFRHRRRQRRGMERPPHRN
jgi:hypothetical protein